MGKNYLIDTNIVSKYFQKRLTENARLMISSLDIDSIYLSVVNRIELLSWLLEDKNLELDIRDFIKNLPEYGLDEDIIQKTIEIRRKVKIKLPDAIIAATAVVHNLVLLSDNDTDFLKVPKLKYLNPTKI